MLSKFSVKKPYTIVVSVILVILLGVISFTSMTTDLLPNMDLPYMIVVTPYPGASPEKVETSVTKPLEQVLATTTNIVNINSISSENSSMLMLEFEQNTNMDSIMVEVSSKLDLVRGSFDEMVGSPSLMKLNPNMMPIMVASVDLEGMDKIELSSFIETNILPELEKVSGVASVSATGLIEEQIQIELNQEKIEDINTKVLKNLDEQLAETEKELKLAQQKLEEGKAQLEQQRLEQTNQMIEGLSQLSDGKTKLHEAKNQVELMTNALNLAKETIEKSLEQLAKEERELLKRQDELLAIANQVQPLDITAEEDKQAVGENGALQDSEADEAPTLPEVGLTPEQELELKVITEQLGVIAYTREELYVRLNETKSKLSEAETGKSSLVTAEAELVTKEKQLESAKLTLNAKLAEASSQLILNEKELLKGVSEFESARDAAYEAANLEGIITPAMISGLLMGENFSMPAGYLETENGSLIVKVGESFQSVEEIEDLLLFTFEIEGLEQVKLKDIADVKLVDNRDAVYAKVNGNDGVVLSFQKQSTASTAEVSDAIEAEFNSLSQKYDLLRFTTLMDQGLYIDIVISSVLNNLMMGGVLAVIILLLFLKDFKPTIIIALSIPISLLFAIVLMYFSQVTINIISLSGLALGVGMLVDNSIVVIENIYRMRKEGVGIITASIEGAKSVAGAIFASTLTTVCVFAPIVFADGLTKQLFKDMGLTIAYSLLASLVVALTLVPMMASKMLKKTTEKPQVLFNHLVKGYERMLRGALKHKLLLFTITFGLLLFSVAMIPKMGTSFMPSMESTQMSVTLKPLEGEESSLRDVTNQVIERLLDIEDIEAIGAMESSSLSLAGGSTGSAMSLYVILEEDKGLSNAQIEALIYEHTSDLACELSVSTSNMDMTALGGSGIEVLVKGHNMDDLQQTADEVAQLLEGVEGIAEISSGLEESQDEIRVIVDKNRAMEYGLTVAGIYSTVAEALKTETTSTQVTIENKDYPIVVVKDEASSLTEATLNDYVLTGTKNQESVEVSLSDVATIERGRALNAINRENQQRYLTVSAQIDSEHNIGLVSRSFEKKLNDYVPVEGISLELSGENETINSTLVQLIQMISLAVVFIYLIMVAQFQSLLSPFIVMFTIPLAFTGGFLALLLTGTELSMIAMLGFLVLSGIIVNNGIVFVDYVNQLRLDGMAKKEALVRAGLTRIRPIMMTALTTILGLSTMALGIGMGADMLQPMGIVTIGGLIYATLLTLFVVPCMYDLLHRKELKKIED